MPALKFLCLHGSGTSAENSDNLRPYAEPLVRELERDNTASFHFVDGELESATPGPGIGDTYESPYYSYHNWPRSLDPSDDRSLREAYDFLYDMIEEEGPFDAVLGFSQGATLAYSFLAQHARNSPYELAPFRCAIFFGALPPFRIKGEDGGVTEQIIYDEDLQGAVSIPTLHVAGKSDFVYPHSIKLHQLCDASWAGLIVHPKGHEIPRDPKNVALIADGIREASHHAMFS
ncbi:putative DUF341 family oxidoreductase [Usnea florida]